MSKLIQKGFFPFPKKLLRDDDFKSLKPASRLIIIYLINLINSFSSMTFYQKPKVFAMELGISKATLFRSKNEIEKMGIIINSKNKKWQVNMIFFCATFLTFKENESQNETKEGLKMTPSILNKSYK